MKDKSTELADYLLDKLEPVLRSTAKSVWASLALAIPALLPILLPESFRTTIWLAITLSCLWISVFLSRQLIQKNKKISQLEENLSRIREESKNGLDGIEAQILTLFYDNYPYQYMKDEVRQKLNLQQIDADGSLRSLCSKGFLVAPPPFKQLIGSAPQNPNGYSITEKGRQKIKNAS